MAPDRDHIHHVLLRRGMGPRTTLATLLAVNVLLAATGMAMWRQGVPDWWIFWSFLGVCAVYFALFFLPLRFYRLRSKAAFVDEYERDGEGAG
jgi:UDP-GlcNAc:undecaprenyl-phosphate GlcNAc-1-phosphate transferase